MSDLNKNRVYCLLNRPTQLIADFIKAIVKSQQAANRYVRSTTPLAFKFLWYVSRLPLTEQQKAITEQIQRINLIDDFEQKARHHRQALITRHQK